MSSKIQFKFWKQPMAAILAGSLILNVAPAKAVDGIDLLWGLGAGVLTGTVFGKGDNKVAAFVIGAVAGTLISNTIRSRLSRRDNLYMEDARYRCLNSESDQPVEWEDEQQMYNSSFQIRGRFYERNSQARCREYIHVVRDRRTGRIVEQSTDVVCWRQNRWEPYRGDRAFLTIETPYGSRDTSPGYAQDRPYYQGQPRPGEYGRPNSQYENEVPYQSATYHWIISPGGFQHLLNDFYNQGNGRYRLEFAQSLVQRLSSRQKFIDLDQLAQLTQYMNRDEGKRELIVILRPVTDTRIGSRRAILQQIQDPYVQNEVRQLLPRQEQQPRY